MYTAVRSLFQKAVHKARSDPAFVFMNIGTATGVNVYKIIQLLSERRSIQLTEMEEDIYARHFLRSGMRPRQFKRLADNARTVEFQDGEILHREGEPFPSTVRLLYKGSVRIMTNNEEIFIVDSAKPICFLGDTHLLEMADKVTGVEQTVPAFSATAVAVAAPNETRVVAVEWDTNFLLKALTDKSETAEALRSVLTNSVMQKLIDVGSTSAVDKYTTLLYAFSVDGALNGLEKKLLKEYREQHGISDETHDKCLFKIGWTKEEYSKGVKVDEALVTRRTWGRVRSKVMGSLAELTHVVPIPLRTSSGGATHVKEDRK